MTYAFESDDRGVIFVGPDRVPFVVAKVGFGKCDYLAVLVKFNNDLRTHIFLSVQKQNAAKDFQPVHEYLQTVKFAPRLLQIGDKNRLEGVWHEVSKEEAALSIAKLFDVATKIRFEALRSLCVQKLQVLQPLISKTLLAVTKTVSRTSSRGHSADRAFGSGSLTTWRIASLCSYERKV